MIHWEFKSNSNMPKNPEKSNALKCWELCFNVETEFPPRYPWFPNKTSKATTFSNFKTQFSFCQVLQVERLKIFTSLSIRLSTEFHKSHVFENNKSLQNWCHPFQSKTNVSPTLQKKSTSFNQHTHHTFQQPRLSRPWRCFFCWQVTLGCKWCHVIKS